MKSGIRSNKPITFPIYAPAEYIAGQDSSAEEVRTTLQTIADSLAIPVTIDIRAVSGSGRFLIGEREFRGVADAAHRGEEALASDLWMFAGQLLTHEVVDVVTRRWSLPSRQERPEFFTTCRQVLLEGVSLGFGLERFRSVCEAALHESPVAPAKWQEAFEDVISDESGSRLRLRVSREQLEGLLHIESTTGGKDWNTTLQSLAEAIFTNSGVLIPPVLIEADESLDSPLFSCEWGDLRLPTRRGLDTQHLLVNALSSTLKYDGIEAITEFPRPDIGTLNAVVDMRHAKKVKELKYYTWNALQYLTSAAQETFKACAAAFVNRSMTELLLTYFSEAAPHLVQAADEAVDRTTLVRVLRGLASEQVSIRPIVGILNAVAGLRGSCAVRLRDHMILPDAITGAYVRPAQESDGRPSVEEYIEFSRWALNGQIARKFSDETEVLQAYLMDARFELELASSNRLGKDERNDLLESCRRELSNLPETAVAPVLLVGSDTRRRLKTELTPEFPRLRVLSYLDLPPDCNVQPVARIS